MNATVLQCVDISESARRRFIAEERRPLMFSDRMNAAIIHIEVEPEILQPQIPFELDLYEGKAYVSIVAFSIRRLRTAIGGQIAEWMFRPIGNHEFFNLRTYVRHRDRVGIYFMAEWLNNRLSVLLGPKAYGLPYRFGQFDYRHDAPFDKLSGEVAADDLAFKYVASTAADRFTECESGSRDEFLLERYTAFTSRAKVGRYFQIWHEPWPMVPLQIDVVEDSLLRADCDWFKDAKVVGGNFSPGVRDIWMSAPHRVRN
jgi:uncharacterized protein YqjF (DUF2071 family)